MKVRIFGTDFDVAYTTIDTQDAVGISNAPHRYIRIDPAAPLDTQGETFYHEVAHMILAMSGVANTLTNEQEEAVAQAIGLGFYRFFLENPVQMFGKESGNELRRY